MSGRFSGSKDPRIIDAAAWMIRRGVDFMEWRGTGRKGEVRLMLFMLCRNPCSTTIYQQTRSAERTGLFVLLPLAIVAYRV